MEKKMSIAPIVEALEKSFDFFNNRFYEGKLPRPVITLAPGAKIHAYGWFVCKNDVWKSKDGTEAATELNISSDYLKRDFAEVVNTLAHEIVHCYNFANGVQDCARAGQRHNKNFKAAAEAHGMKWIDPGDDEAEKAYYNKFGFSHVEVAEDVKDEVFAALEFLRQALSIYREVIDGSKIKKKSIVLKYVCPVCGCSCRATKEINIACADCDEPMLLA